jgi:hypothetical protein
VTILPFVGDGHGANQVAQDHGEHQVASGGDGDGVANGQSGYQVDNGGNGDVSAEGHRGNQLNSGVHCNVQEHDAMDTDFEGMYCTLILSPSLYSIVYCIII